VVLQVERVPHGPLPHTSGGKSRALGRADGVVPDGVTVFDLDVPAVTRLDPALLRALRRAAAEASREGVTVYVTSGWRSWRYQEQLFREAVAKYGSSRAAERWVAAPGRSAHESGDAVDLGHAAATAWLTRHGAAYGLCQVYRTEPWHYELRPAAVRHGCPRMYDNPSQDPRLSG
jgi:hypothetical protein